MARLPRASHPTALLSSKGRMEASSRVSMVNRVRFSPFGTRDAVGSAGEAEGRGSAGGGRIRDVEGLGSSQFAESLQGMSISTRNL
jgi:hypothetical protein